MKTIADKIQLCAREYTDCTGLTPTRVYLGSEEMVALHNWCFGNDLLMYDDSQISRKFMGMRVFEVKDDNEHIRCCL